MFFWVPVEFSLTFTLISSVTVTSVRSIFPVFVTVIVYSIMSPAWTLVLCVSTPSLSYIFVTFFVTSMLGIVFVKLQSVIVDVICEYPFAGDVT